MAGHSHFANIQRRKEVQDKKRGGLFTKIIREVTVAARLGGPDPNFNPRLRSAVLAAKAASVPKDRIEAAIKKGAGTGEGENYEELRYEGYAAGGVALILDILTDNRNRTASDVRSILTKFGGTLGETGCVAFMFDRVGLILYPAEKGTADQMFEAALEAGATNCESGPGGHEITCEPDALSHVREALAKHFGDPEAARLSWKPKNLVPVSDPELAQKITKLMDALEEHDDVQYIFANYDIPEALRS